MDYFWVNQKQTFRQEWKGGFLWAPKRNQKGDTQWHWETMQLPKVGDVIFSYVNQAIRAYGIVQSPAITKAKPDTMASSPWETEGWYIKLAYTKLNEPIFIRETLSKTGHLFPNRHSPYSVKTQRGNQIYLAQIGDSLGLELRSFIKDSVPLKLITPTRLELNEAVPDRTQNTETILHEEEEFQEIDMPNVGSLEAETVELTPSEKDSIVKQRTIQGKFREALMKKFSGRCALTGLNKPELLIASHIKPWSISDEAERRDVNNGLLLAAPIDSLFDKHLISFYKDGKIILSKTLGLTEKRVFNVNDRMTLREKPNMEMQQYLLEHKRILNDKDRL